MRMCFFKNGCGALMLLLVCATISFAQKTAKLSSPNRSIQFYVNIKNGNASYGISYKSKVLIKDAGISWMFANAPMQNHLTMGKTAYREGEEAYELVTGKTKSVRERYNELIIPIEQSVNHARLNLIVRAFNDGVAFRYEFIAIPGQKTFELNDERVAFNFNANPTATVLFLPSYTSSHEGFYTRSAVGEIKDNMLMDMPALFEFPDHVFMGITEAALLDYAGMYLMKEHGGFRGMLSPSPENPVLKVKGAFPHKSPWRVFMISDRVGALIESNILTNLCEPNRIKDVSWIKPGKTTFPWWNGNVTPDTLNAPGNNFVTQQYYIDFCARNNIQYHSVVEYGLHQWYVDDGVGFQPGPHNDVTKAVPGLDMKEVCDYAHAKGVGVRVWVQWAALYPRLDSAFAQWERWGLSGMMIDFMDRDDQEMVNIQTEMLEKAAKHHLHVQFHGAYKPTGLHRTYPNEFTREGTLNYEINKWDDAGLPPDHDINIPFTRMLGGSTDYHLGGFRAVPKSEYRQQYTRPLMLGTRCHMMAMYVVLENYLGMVCDYPDAYEGQPGFNFIREVPTVWDETKVLDAMPGEFIVIARRKGAEWYVGAINNSKKRSLNIPLQFLGDKTYRAVVSTDVNGNVNGVAENIKDVMKMDQLSITLESGGGMVARITPK